MFHRLINPFKNNSFFLFGARSTGKTTLLNKCFSNIKNVFKINLLDYNLEKKYLSNPNIFIQEINANKIEPEWVFIDEIQKVPSLLNIIHTFSNSSKIKFAVTGSSARKLKRGVSNLLAGRLFVFNLYPLTSIEIGASFDLNNALAYGTLPSVLNYKDEEQKKLFLKAYSNTYLKEEIKEEQLVRKLDPFIRFLEIASQMDTEEINYTSIARDVLCDVKTVQSYFSILEDTLIGNIIHPYYESIRKTQSKASKFYFFDNGVKRALDNSLNLNLNNKTFEYGKAFENFIFNECIRLNSYLNKDYRFFFFRTKDGIEVDMLIERPGMPLALIEIKSSSNINESHLSSINKIFSSFKNAEAFCFSLDKTSKKINNVWSLYWQEGIKEIGLSI